MFWRRKSRIAPKVDPYITRRYEDMAACIQADIANNRGLYSYYTPWLDQIMEKFNLPQEYRLRHSLVATDSHGRHIGCSGAKENKLVYYNPVTPEREEQHRSQSREAKRKSALSEKFKDSKIYAKRSKSLEDNLNHRLHPLMAVVQPAKTAVMQSHSSAPAESISTQSGSRKGITFSEHSTLKSEPSHLPSVSGGTSMTLKSESSPSLNCHLHNMPSTSGCRSNEHSDINKATLKSESSPLNCHLHSMPSSNTCDELSGLNIITTMTSESSPLDCHLHSMPSTSNGICNEHSGLNKTPMKSKSLPLHQTPEGDVKVTHSVSDSRPQSADSYYARIDEAFRKHRNNLSKQDEEGLNLFESKDKGIMEDRTAEQNQETGSSHSGGELDKNQSTTTRKSKFCTVL